MGIDYRLLAEYREALNHVGHDVVTFEVSVYQLSCIVALLQKSLTLPHVRQHAGPTVAVVETLTRVWTEFLRRAHPALGRVADVGWRIPTPL